MSLYKNKWEMKTWAQLSASVGDSTNALEFRPKHRLPLTLQQGAKASKNSTGFFNRDSIVTAPDYPDGYYIYDTGSGLSYTAMERDRFKVDMTNFLNSSSLSIKPFPTIFLNVLNLISIYIGNFGLPI